MADYSGYWHCKEEGCPANGDGYSYPTPHMIGCPAEVRRITMELERREAKLQQQAFEDADREEWRQLDDDAFLIKLWRLDREAGELYGDYKEVEDQRRRGIEVMRERGNDLRNSFLNRHLKETQDD